jgi:hypothetical protein
MASKEPAKPGELSKPLRAMSPDELDEARDVLVHLLLTDCDGLVGSRRAYEQSEKLPVQLLIVFDALKWVKDEISKTARRQMFQDLAERISKVTSAAYNVHNDGFVVQASTREEAEGVVSRLRENLSLPLVGAALPDGRTIERQGVEFLYGIGETLGHAEIDLAERRSRIPGKPWWAKR